MARRSTADSILLCVTAPHRAVPRLQRHLIGKATIHFARRNGTNALLIIETTDATFVNDLCRLLTCHRDTPEEREPCPRSAPPQAHLPRCLYLVADVDGAPTAERRTAPNALLSTELVDSAEAPNPRRSRRLPRVVVLDDDFDTHAFVHRALRPDAEIIPHTSARGALRSLTTSTIDALVLDLILTGSNGLDLLRQLSDDHRPPRIVVLTGWRAGIERARNLGATTTLSKPCTVETLRSAVLGRTPPSYPKDQQTALAQTHTLT